MRRAALFAVLALASVALSAARRPAGLHLPYREAGLTERQAAAHLLDRFTFGARPGEVDRVAGMGPARWLEQQLSAGMPEPALEEALARLDAVEMPPGEIVRTFPPPARLRAAAVRAGVISREDTAARGEARRKLRAYARGRGLRPQQQLVAQLQAQKLYRALHAENQLREVLVDFWFNHFNVSLTDRQARPHLLAYERDAVRPHVLGDFRTLLGATAKHPAMLLYLDNAQSTAAEGAPTTRGPEADRRRGRTDRATARPRGGQDSLMARPSAGRPRRGLNENYARELLELHTLGVDGGYTQQDVVEVARALTGWTVFPRGGRGERIRMLLARQRGGFVREGGFLFRADAHDAGAKTILGEAFPAGGGLEEGERVLDRLARHPSTARHVARKLAARFVADDPPEALVDRLARSYLRTGGDLRALVAEIAASPEFWSPDVRRAKIKSPFRLAAGAVRALGATVERPRGLLDWVRDMGQTPYGYQAPTGYPDRAESWINTGSLLSRMNFGLNLAAGRIPGVRLDPAALDGGREPESASAALERYAALLLPERDLREAVEPLRAAAADPRFAEKLAEKHAAPAAGASAPPPSPLAHVVGILLGSPEYQRY